MHANFEIPDYVLDEAHKVPDQFILDFASSLEEDAPGVYYFAKWNGSRINDGIDCKESDGEFSFFYKGKEKDI